MEDLTLLLKEELRKKAKKQEYIKKSFSTLNESTDDRILWEYIEISSKLIDEGYNPDEFDLIVEQDVINRVKDAASNAIQAGGLVDMGKKAWDKTHKIHNKIYQANYWNRKAKELAEQQETKNIKMKEV